MNKQKTFRVTFTDHFTATDEDDAYTRVIDYLRDVVRNEDVTAFDFVEVEPLDHSDEREYTIRMEFEGWSSTATRRLRYSPKHTDAHKWFHNCVAICGKDERGVPAVTASLIYRGVEIAQARHGHYITIEA